MKLLSPERAAKALADYRAALRRMDLPTLINDINIYQRLVVRSPDDESSAEMLRLMQAELLSRNVTRCPTCGKEMRP